MPRLIFFVRASPYFSLFLKVHRPFGLSRLGFVLVDFLVYLIVPIPREAQHAIGKFVYRDKAAVVGIKYLRQRIDLGVHVLWGAMW